MDFFEQILTEQSFDGGGCGGYDASGQDDSDAGHIFECQRQVEPLVMTVSSVKPVSFIPRV